MLMSKLPLAFVACALHLGAIASPLPLTERTTESGALGGDNARRAPMIEGRTGLVGGSLGSGVSTLLDGVNYGLTGSENGVETGSGLLGGALGSGVGTLLTGAKYGLTGSNLKEGV
ncbi:hypothetical protein GALMADRAFT_215361 [Galerina marginata CBS 339.88]|uniref:Uncharacterized protein n=1 Tax=Galerina marginata (strain CBS 339.88) TaxID=685588 RepID=A0A067SMY6_GALM3|nr:hypothetical protein GALMADRAFT_215361 [Galerina marginata CBS 339.88]